MKEITFITTNKHKVKEISVILKEFNIKVKQINLDYEEDKEDSLEAVSKKAAKFLANKLKKPIIVEDTGLFFKAYNNFPGALPKFVFQGIGYAGIFRLLKNKNRQACFKTVVGYCQPRKKPVVFSGEMHGRITSKIIKPQIDAMLYDHIFIPKGYKKAIVEMSIEEKNSFSQRGKATRKLGKFLNKK